MNIRNKIRRILREELASLMNPLDKSQDKVALSAAGFRTRVDALKNSSKKEVDDLKVNIGAKTKAKTVPQSNDQSIERERRKLMDKELQDLQDRLQRKKEEQEEIDAMAADITGLSTSLSDMERERDELSNMLGSMGGNEEM